MSYWHHFASVVVVRRLSSVNFLKIFSSETTEQNFLKLDSNDLWHVGYKDSSFRIDRTKNMAAVTKNRPWGSNSSFSHIIWKQKQLSKFREILGRSTRQDLSAVQFSWRSVNRCRSYCPFMSFFQIFQLWHLITRKRKQLSKFWDILGCSAREDLSAVLIPCRSMKRCWSYCPFNAVFSNVSTLAFNISESIIAREVIQIGICSFRCAEHNGAMKFYFRAAIFFKMAATILQKCKLCLISMKINI